ncbi:MAG TPA: diguanylate cyclase [Candidatus Dormibacteraeota bacterium]|jgi:diguanylate cyclase (GGDEF)-like protein/PAS domain S-box-containing protein|nr:diguanylate cyclase [Candidatus Dormibacteraeota bacterium]
MNTIGVLSGSYDQRLVALSVLLAVFASYAALDLAGRVTSAHGRARAIWLGAGAAAMGLGIWAMHYVGMLALTTPMPVAYHLPTVVLSLLAAIAASAVALFVVSRTKMSVWQGIAGSVVMGSGIAAMHYIGMAAMRCPALIVYDRRIVALSIELAIATALVALRFTFLVRDEERVSWRKIICALVMGSATLLMHYTGMWAASFRPSGVAPDLTHATGISMIGVVAISASSVLVLAGAIASSFVDRLMAMKGHLSTARERELYFQTMAEAVPEIIWTATPDGEDDYFNQKCFDYTGMTLEQLRGSAWKRIVHPDDVDDCYSKWQTALGTGESYDVEYRLRAKDGSFRWFLGRANPIRNTQGQIVKWFGTCTDIEDQKRNQQVLEQQILERTMQLADTNTRLQEEMSERDLARRELDQQNERMMEDLKKRSDRATMLAKMGELLQSCVDLKEVVAAALGFAPRIFPVTRGAMALLNDSRSLAEVVGSWTGCQLPAMDFDPIACWALRTGHPHLVLADDSTAPCGHAAGVKNTYLCIPILAQGKTLGILHFQATDEAPQLEASELSFKTTFAAQVGLSIANIKLREALRTQSVRDALTGLYNRRYLEEVLDREVRRASRAAQSLGVLMIDLDHFKSFNDTYGHDAGDAVLREIAVSLTKGIRAEDFVCRFGGEEFVVILPTADLAASRTRAERLRSRTKEFTILYQGKSMGMITISVGVAAFPEHGTSPKELMAAADEALYEAKRGGRDQVVVAAAKAAEEAAPPTAGKEIVSWG